jgi:thiol-disulfide isomerase/thioredoxin
MSLAESNDQLKGITGMPIARKYFFTLGLSISSLSFAAGPSAREALVLTPVQKDSITWDLVTEKELEQCRLEQVSGDGGSGYEVYSGSGVLLRRFLDTNQDKRLDVWSYFGAGVEVYRDIDSNFNGNADQYRWLGTAGTRWGIDENEDRKIDRWKQISAQEVSSEVIAALAGKDTERFLRLLPNSSEIKGWGLGKETQDKIIDRVTAATKDIRELMGKQKSVSPNSKWTHFAAGVPGTVPQGTFGLATDMLVHEGVVAMIETEGKSGQVYIGTIVQSPQGWRLTDLPIPLAEGQPLTDVAGIFFSGRTQPTSESSTKPSNGQDQLVASLEKIEAAMTAAAGKDKEKLKVLHQQRAEIYEKIAQAASGADREVWYRQLIETMYSAVTAGEYPEGMTYLNKLSDRLVDAAPSVAGFAKYQTILAEYSLKQSEPKVDYARVQNWWLDQLEDFVREFGDDPQSAEALRQLGFMSELEQDNEKALKFYRQAVTKFPQADASRIAQGAARRLQSVNRPLELKGVTLEGRNFDLKSLVGRPVVIQYWASWSAPTQQDMKLLKTLVSRYQDRKLTVVGINVDEESEKANALKIVKAEGVTWPQLYEPGGLERSRLATELGVQTLPMMLLVDASGKLIRHSIQGSELDKAVAELGKK